MENENKDIVAFDCHSPKCIAEQLSNTVMYNKANYSFIKLLILGILAGVYIGFGTEFATTIAQDSAKFVGYGITKLLMGCAFSVGLMLVLIAGADLFTGNTLIMLAVLEKKTKITALLRNWAIVYFANFIGAFLLVLLIFYSKTWDANHMLPAIAALKFGAQKTSLTFTEAFCRGILCNWLVCLAVWMSFASRQVIGKIFAIFFPIVAFIACGFEHCVANMFYIPKALMLKHVPEVVTAAGLAPELLSNLTVKNFVIHNLIPVTLGNIVGAVVFIAFLYWFAFLKPNKA